MPRRFTFFLVLAALAVLTPAAAQPSEDDVRVRLVSFSPWSAPDRPLALAVEVANVGTAPLEDVTVRLTIRDRVRSRSALRSALDGSTQGDGIAVTTEDLDAPVAIRQTAQVVIQRDLGSLATTFRPGRARSGVYPIGIRVQAGGRTVAERSGAFVFLASPPETALNLVWMLPVHRPIAFDAAGAYDRTALGRELGQGGRLRALVDLLAAHPAVPLTLAPSGIIVDQLVDLSDGFVATAARGARESVPATDPLATAAGEALAVLRTAVASQAFEIATAPYARADLVSLVAGELGLDAGRQITIGRSRIAALLGREPTPSLFADGALRADTRSARTLAALGARTLVVDPGVLRDRPAGRFGPERPEEVRASGLTFQALLADVPLRQRIEAAGEDPVLAAQGILAETAASYFELPGLAAGRLLVLATPGSPEPSVAAPLLDAIAQAPWLRVRTASEAAADTALRSESDPRGLVTAGAERSDRLAQARAARREVDLLDRVLSGSTEVIDALDRLVLASESADYTRRPNVASALARAARGQAERYLEQISVPPRRVTLTARGGRVPVTIRNDTGFPVRIRLRLDSPKVRFPDGSVRVVEVEGRLETLAFVLQARTAGSFPITVYLETPEGDVIGTGQLLVRSTAVSAVTLMATAGGALFLLGAWGRRAWGRRAAGRRPEGPGTA